MHVSEDEAENIHPGVSSVDTVEHSGNGFSAALKAGADMISKGDTEKVFCCLDPTKSLIAERDISSNGSQLEGAAGRRGGHKVFINHQEKLIVTKMQDSISVEDALGNGDKSSLRPSVTEASGVGECAPVANFAPQQSMNVATEADADLNQTRSAPSSISSDSVQEEDLLEEEESLPPSADYSLITSGSIDSAYVALEAARPLSDLPPPKVGEWVESKAAHEDAHIFRARVVARYRDLEHKWIFKLRSPDMASCYIEPLKHVRKGSVWTMARELDLAAGRKARRQSQGRRQIAAASSTSSATVTLTGAEASSPKRVSQRVSARSSRSSIAESSTAAADVGKLVDNQQRRKSAPPAGLIRHKVKRQSQQQPEGLLEESLVLQAAQRRRVISNGQRDDKTEDMQFLRFHDTALNDCGNVPDAFHTVTNTSIQNVSVPLREWNVPLLSPFGTQPGNVANGPLQGPRKRRSLPAYNHFTKLFANSSLFAPRTGKSRQEENTGI